jgi:hypothetical protein
VEERGTESGEAGKVLKAWRDLTVWDDLNFGCGRRVERRGIDWEPRLRSGLGHEYCLEVICLLEPLMVQLCFTHLSPIKSASWTLEI